MFIDVQGTLLFYVVAAWEDDFTGYVIDYGAYPDQRRPYFTLRDARPTLSRSPRGPDWRARSTPGWRSLRESISAGSCGVTTAPRMRIERCLIDANWGLSTDVVYQFCRQSAHSAVLLPSHGRFVGPRACRFPSTSGKWATGWGTTGGFPTSRAAGQVRHVVYDTNYWKSFVHARLAVAMGDRGCLSLFGDKPDLHRLFAEHITAEYRVKTEGRGRTVDEWKPRAEAVENHWLDCLVGSAVAASIQGTILPGTDVKPLPKRPRVKLSELQHRRK